MAEIKWIKITTNMFEDDKIDFIESLPEADAILVIWIKLLTLTGKCNAGGFIFLTEDIPYTDEMLAHKFRRPLSTVKLALETLRKLDMIQYDENGFLYITNWKRHQNIEGMEKIREQTRKRVAKHRKNQKLLSSNEKCNATVTGSNETDIDLDIDIDIEEDIDIDLERDLKREGKTTTTTLTKTDINSIIEKWNSLNLQTLKSINPNTTRYTMLKARIKEYSISEVLKTIDIIDKCSFLKGQNKNGWTITFDWFIKPNNFIKVLEGNYKDGTDNKDNGKSKWNLDPSIFA